MNTFDTNLSVEAMLNWLVGDRILLPDGGVLSWDNPSHPGYRYPEAAGLLLMLLAQQGPAWRFQCDLLVRGLIQDRSQAGGYGRGGHDYAFDTAIVLSAVLAHQQGGGTIPDPELPHTLLDFLDAVLQSRQATRLSAADTTHWSYSYGCHLLKVVRALASYHDVYRDPRCLVLIRSLCMDLLPLYTQGRFRIHHRAQESYLHAACYAVEGLLCLESRALATVGPLIQHCAEWLAETQAPGGGFRAWHDGRSAYGPLRADVTAQAVRIWSCVNRLRFKDSIQRALDFLAELQTPVGGLSYEPGSADVNTWATIFAVQAALWARAGGVEHRAA